MKKISFLITLIIMLSSACSNNDESTQTGEASVEIKLVGSNPDLSTRAVGTPTLAQENGIKNFTVYIFSNNVLEKSQTFSNATAGTMTGLKTGSKKIVVVANPPASFPVLAIGSNYTALADVSRYILLDDQKDFTNGLTMSGEANAILEAVPTPNPVDVSIGRIVAKIMLGSITITPDPGYDAAKLTLDGVAIIKAKSKASVGVPSVVTVAPLYSGIEGPMVTGTNIKPYLFETITKTDFTNRYFYVFPNDNLNDNGTLMTLMGTYDGKTVYFPFRIEMPKGTFIYRNTQHIINVTLKRLGSGSPDPETPSYPATLDVTITPQDWILLPVQNAEW